MMTANSVS